MKIHFIVNYIEIPHHFQFLWMAKSENEWLESVVMEWQSVLQCIEKLCIFTRHGRRLRQNKWIEKELERHNKFYSQLQTSEASMAHLMLALCHYKQFSITLRHQDKSHQDLYVQGCVAVSTCSMACRICEEFFFLCVERESAQKNPYWNDILFDSMYTHEVSTKTIWKSLNCTGAEKCTASLCVVVVVLLLHFVC